MKVVKTLSLPGWDDQLKCEHWWKSVFSEGQCGENSTGMQALFVGKIIQSKEILLENNK